jgi:hypothetical protein
MEKTLDHSPRIIGHPNSRDLAQVQSGNLDLLRFCRWEQMVAGMNNLVYYSNLMANILHKTRH